MADDAARSRADLLQPLLEGWPYALIVGIGLAAVVLGTRPDLSPGALSLVNGVVLAILPVFAAEIVLRLRRAGRGYLSTIGGVTDVAGVVTIPLLLLAGVGLPDARLAGMLWLLKLARLSPALQVIGLVIRNEHRALVGVLIGFVMVLLTAGTLAYLLERHDQPDAFSSIPSALWWSIVTLTTTGYGDRIPVTTSGQILAGIVMICGIAGFALWAGILATGFAEESRRQIFLRSWDLVSRVPLLQNLEARTIADIVHLLRPLDLPAGRAVVRKGEQGTSMYFVAQGNVSVQLPDRAIRLPTGSFFGEMALITGGPRTADVVTETPVSLLVLDVADFRRLAASSPELTAAIRDEAKRRSTG
ncbi:MAG: cyclic nucleotide-gated ion channel [Geminicoccaceae bacterium]